MKVTLIYNPSAGAGDPAARDKLVSIIRDADHRVVYQSSKDEGWQSALKSSADLVAIAGGDGTVSKVARRLMGTGMPLAILPMGTANNLARTLELTEVPLQELVSSWTAARHVPFDVGVANGPWGEDVFLESVGTGLFAWTMARFDRRSPKDGDSPKDLDQGLESARHFLRDRLQRFPPRRFHLKLDGIDLSGEFLMLEAMNIRSIGPNLCLAPEADPGDGLLDVVLVPPVHHDKLHDHLERQAGDCGDFPEFIVHRCQTLHIQGESSEFHLDDRPWPKKNGALDESSISVEVRLNSKSLVFLAPGTSLATKSS